MDVVILDSVITYKEGLQQKAVIFKCRGSRRDVDIYKALDLVESEKICRVAFFTSFNINIAGCFDTRRGYQIEIKTFEGF